MKALRQALMIAMAGGRNRGAVRRPGRVAHRRYVPSLAGATGWLNSPPLTPADLRGKVVLLDVWTYTCINWIRTLPYVRAWADKYKDHGLVVIGVHSPEFPFEHDLDNVRRGAPRMRVAYPVAIDNDFAIWKALNNQYWPALYLVDAQGAFAITNSARVVTTNRNGSSSNCCSRPEEPPPTRASRRCAGPRGCRRLERLEVA